MIVLSCPCCGSETNTFFVETESGASGYRCPLCGCRFIILMMGAAPDPGEDDTEDHAKDVWPN